MTPPPAPSKIPLPKPNKIVTYPIGSGSGSDENGGALYLFGNAATAKRLILMCPGYPDDHENMLPLANRLADGTSSFVGVACLPGYDSMSSPADQPYTVRNPDGYSFQEWVGALREAVKCLREESGGEAGSAAALPLTGIFHDWGVAAGLMWTNQALEDNSSNAPDRIVLLDVLLPPHPDDQHKVPAGVPKDTFREVVLTVSYRVLLASCFALRRYVSGALAQVVFGLGFAVFGPLKLSPMLEVDTKVHQSRHVPIVLDRLVYMAYPYYNMFKAVLGNRMAQDFHGCILPRDLKRTPVLYLWGTEKRVMFHSKDSVALLEQEHEEGNDRSCNAIAVEGAGHWLYLHKPDVCFDYISNFVKDA